MRALNEQGIVRTEFESLATLADAVSTFNADQDQSSDEGLLAEVTLWREGSQIARLTDTEGGGMSLRFGEA